MSEFTLMHTFTLHHMQIINWKRDIKLIAAFLRMRPHTYILTLHYHVATNITCALTKPILFIAMCDIKSCVLKKKNHYLLDMTVVHYLRVLDCLLGNWCGSFFAGSTENITMICLVSAKRNMENKQCPKRCLWIFSTPSFASTGKDIAVLAWKADFMGSLSIYCQKTPQNNYIVTDAVPERKCLVVGHWNKPPREVAESPSLEIFKA